MDARLGQLVKPKNSHDPRRRAHVATMAAAAALWIVSLVLPAQAQEPCVGDCNEDDSVTVDELITGVNIALGQASLDSCTIFDSNGDMAVTVDELITAVNNALLGCGFVPPTPTATPEPGNELGERVFSVREDTVVTVESRSALVTSALGAVFPFPNVAMSFTSGPIRLMAGSPDGDGVAPVTLAEDAIFGGVVIDGSGICFKILAAGSSGTIDCDGRARPDLVLNEVTGRDVPPGEVMIVDGDPTGPGSVILDVMAQQAQLPIPADPATQCATAPYPAAVRMVFTTGRAMATKGAQVYPGPTNPPIEGENFSCDEWTMENGPGMLVTPLVAFQDAAGGDVANALRIADN